MTGYEEADARYAAAALDAMDARLKHGEASVPYAEALERLKKARRQWLVERSMVKPRARRAA